MELHSRELLNDEHQYDGPQVQRLLPTITAREEDRFFQNESPSKADCRTWLFSRRWFRHWFTGADGHQAAHSGVSLGKGEE